MQAWSDVHIWYLSDHILMYVLLIYISDFLPVGNGIGQLRDDCMDTYWQSDGQLPHLVNIQFRRKTTVRDICIYFDYKIDESYCPSRYVLEC